MKWIPTNERLPDKQDDYLVTIPLDNNSLYVYVLHFHKGKFYETDSEWGDVVYDDVLAWMPLPEPYKTEQTEPNSSEKPNNCETCEHWNDTEDGCADRHGCKDEPQRGYMWTCPKCGTENHSDFKKCPCCGYTPQTDCDTCRYNSDEWDSPKCDGCSKAHSNYEPQTDCPWR